MKKLLSVVMVLLLMFTLFSCKRNGQDNQEDKNVPNYVIQSASYEYTDAETLAEKADLILVGEYTGKSSQMIPDSEKEKEMPSDVYTDYVMNVVKTVKGDIGDTVNIRMFGGEYNGLVYTRTDNTDFKPGEKYLMYLLKQTTPKTENDIECYFLISGGTNCYKIDDSGELEFRGGKSDEDASKINSLYKSKVDTDALAEKD